MNQKTNFVLICCVVTFLVLNVYKHGETLVQYTIPTSQEKILTVTIEDLLNHRVAIENFTSYIMTRDDGRSGNVLSAYSSLMYYHYKYGFHPVLKEGQLKQIYHIFKKENLSIRPYNFTDPSKDLKLQWKGVGDQDFSNGRGYGLWVPGEKMEQNATQFLHNRFLDIGLYPHCLWLFKEYLPQLRKEFVFHDHLVSNVSEWKKTISKEEGEKKKIIYVGVHCRRTDYGNHLNVVSKGATLVDKRFFDAAFKIYREKYNKKRKKVIFLAVSDDNEWLKKNLGSEPDVRFGVDHREAHMNSTDGVGFDLCVLASCDHSIHTYGTFGLWGSLLAGGDVVVAKGTSYNTTTEEDEIYMRAAMPGWLYIDTRNNQTTVLKLNETQQFVPA